MGVTCEKCRYKILWLGAFVMSLLGCSGLSVAELQDARTLKPGRISVMGALTTGPGFKDNLESPSSKVQLFPGLKELRIGAGVTQYADFHVSTWSGLAPFIEAGSKKSSSAYDYGVKVNPRIRITPEDNSVHIAMGLGGTYYTRHLAGDDNDFDAKGLSGTLTISKEFQVDTKGQYDSGLGIEDLGSVYCGFRVNRFQFNRQLGKTRSYFYNGFAGVRSSGIRRQSYLELTFTRIRNPFNDKYENMVTVGLATTFRLGSVN